jgi:D-3-phosphoglycerate dehydrogenase
MPNDRRFSPDAHGARSLQTTPSLIVIPADDPVQLAGSPHLDRLRPFGDVVLYRDRPRDDAEKLRRLADATVLINSRSAVKWPGELLRQLPQLRFITVVGIGTDSIDLQAARELGIVVSNIPGRTANIVAEHALALMLATARKLADQTAELRAGRWTNLDLMYLGGKTLGVVGTGAIGSRMIQLGRAIGMRIIAWTFRASAERAVQLGVDFVELDELLRQSDVVSLHVKLTPESRGLIGRREFSLMRPGSILVNTARGALVDTRALVEALHSGHLGGAGLDVFDTEPLPPAHPILTCKHVVLTPHNADQTPEGFDILNGGAVDNVIAFLENRSQNVVT